MLEGISEFYLAEKLRALELLRAFLTSAFHYITGYGYEN